MDIKKGLGRRVKELRKKHNMTQEVLSEMLGIETISLSKIETGRSYPTSENLAKLCKILKVEPYEFFILSKAPEKKEIISSIENLLNSIKSDESKLLMVNGFLKSIVK
ncbi:MAG: helix-turn-helix transcriptional regulator [Candidatus Gastranaerophilales bacterium]